MSDLEEAMDEADSSAFVSVSEIYKVLGHFYEPKLWESVTQLGGFMYLSE